MWVTRHQKRLRFEIQQQRRLREALRLSWKACPQTEAS